MISLYGPKPPACPLPFAQCGACNIYPCLLASGPAVAPDRTDEQSDYNRRVIEGQGRRQAEREQEVADDHQG